MLWNRTFVHLFSISKVGSVGSGCTVDEEETGQHTAWSKLRSGDGLTWVINASRTST
jgi:hypothetical protein